MGYAFAAADESGQTGFKFDRGSTPLFVLTLVLTNEPELIAAELDRLRRALRLPNGTEFRFHSTPDAHRQAFLNRAAVWPLVARALYMDKRLLPARFARLQSWELYAHVAAQLLDRLPPGELERTTVTLDEFGPTRLTMRALRELLRRAGLWGRKNSPIKRLAFQRSQSVPLIQVADMVGGALYRHLTEGDERYFWLVQDRCRVWEYQPMNANPPT